MDDTLKKALCATGLVGLMEAYEVAEESLKDRDISNLNSIDLVGWSHEEACYLEIIISTNKLLPFLTRPSDSGESATLGTITTLELIRLNECSGRFLDKVVRKVVDPEYSTDPVFELSNRIRASVLVRV